MQIGFVCSVCLSIFADQKFAICPMCDSKIAGPAGTFDKGAERPRERREREERKREPTGIGSPHMLPPRTRTQSFLVPTSVCFHSKLSLSPPPSIPPPSPSSTPSSSPSPSPSPSPSLARPLSRALFLALTLSRSLYKSPLRPLLQGRARQKSARLQWARKKAEGRRQAHQQHPPTSFEHRISTFSVFCDFL